MKSYRVNCVVILCMIAACAGCGNVGAVIGGFCTNADASCPEGQYCRFADGACEGVLAIGLCTDKPEACTLEFNPVCGCDGQTYGNRCEAAAAGTSVASQGACDSDGSGDECGGLQGLDCEDEDEYCKFPDGTCGAADQTGVCLLRADVCAEIFAPVCGCDDQTYGNACEAAMAGVSIVSDGDCPSGDDCGGLQGLDCEDEDEYCRFPDGTCGAADETGTCQRRPDFCTDIFAPVCGCDDETYGNACEAARAGVSIVSEGECPDDNDDDGGPN